jgi:hypothetical protein
LTAQYDDGITALLRLIARRPAADPDPAELGHAVGGIARWEELPGAAEAHGLAPLVEAHLAAAGVAMPVAVRQRLFGLAGLHREANAVRVGVLAEILDAFDAARIPVLVLKGAALGHILYASPRLRPLSDVDLLVEPALVSRAQATLAALGFTTPCLQGTKKTPAGHHHLPAVALYRGGHLVQVEVHRDAFAGDDPGTMTLARGWSGRQAFDVQGRTAYALGHLDMLHHLVRHAVGFAPILRLIWVADIFGYAARFHREIDWQALRRRRPFVVNALSLLHLVTPLPPEVLEHVTPHRLPVEGVGQLCRPLTAIAAPGRPLREVARELLLPSEWWLRLYYGVSGGAALRWQRWAGHPLRVGWWLARRGVARVRRPA